MQLQKKNVIQSLDYEANFLHYYLNCYILNKTSKFKSIYQTHEVYFLEQISLFLFDNKTIG